MNVREHESDVILVKIEMYCGLIVIRFYSSYGFTKRKNSNEKKNLILWNFLSDDYCVNI